MKKKASFHCSGAALTTARGGKAPELPRPDAPFPAPYPHLPHRPLFRRVLRPHTRPIAAARPPTPLLLRVDFAAHTKKTRILRLAARAFPAMDAAALPSIIVHCLWSCVALTALFVVHRSVERYAFVRASENIPAAMERIGCTFLGLKRQYACARAPPLVADAPAFM